VIRTKGADRVVVDASLALKWVLDEVDSAAALALLNLWARQRLRALAPGWFACEVANALHQRVRRGQLNEGEARQLIRVLVNQVVLLDVEPATAERALTLAALLQRPITYDTQYAALAERERCELWTADERFWNAARARFAWVRWVGEQERG
jgi:predicted nucleic acid-binding protein